MAVAICQRLKRSRAVWERVAYLVRNHLRLVSAPLMRKSTLTRFLREDGIDELLELARIDATASNGDLQYYEFCRAQLRGAFSAQQMNPPALVTGRDLIAIGLTAGTALQRDPPCRRRAAARRRARRSRRRARLGALALSLSVGPPPAA